jgi:hypothetical protein
MEEQATLVVDEASTEYVGRWNRLISTTNWEKGRIICQWRDALRQIDSEPSVATDEAWSCQVGGVSPQHVGRLRRVFERFGQDHERYTGLYWSHFQAACEWLDAEMYLQGAVESGWSVSQMRQQRCEAMGGEPDQEPDLVDFADPAVDLDEDASDDAEARMPESVAESIGDVHGASDLPRDEPETAPFETDLGDESDSLPADNPSLHAMRPFEALPALPSDLNEAFELMKLAILNHKISGWREISCEGVLAVVDSLKQLALAPAG